MFYLIQHIHNLNVATADLVYGNSKKDSLGELSLVKMKGSGGESMHHKTFGNMIHPRSHTNYVDKKWGGG